MELICKKTQLENGLELHQFIVTAVACRILSPQQVLCQMTRCRLIFDYEVEEDLSYNMNRFFIKCIDTTKEVCRYEI